MLYKKCEVCSCVFIFRRPFFGFMLVQALFRYLSENIRYNILLPNSSRQMKSSFAVIFLYTKSLPNFTFVFKMLCSTHHHSFHYDLFNIALKRMVSQDFTIFRQTQRYSNCKVLFSKIKCRLILYRSVCFPKENSAFTFIALLYTEFSERYFPENVGKFYQTKHHHVQEKAQL